MSNLSPGVRDVQRPAAALKSLVAQASTGAGTGFALGGAFATFGVQLTRATTGAAGGSTKASVKLQGSHDGVHWYTIGAATMALNSTAGSLFARASTAGPVTWARLNINTFTTSAGANPDKVAVTGYITCSGV